MNAPALFPELAQHDAAPACPICGTSETRFHTKAHDIEYCTSSDVYSWRGCDPCGVLFLDPMPVDRLGEIYPANYYSYSEGKASVVQSLIHNYLM